MARNFSTSVSYNGKNIHVVILREVRPDGAHFEINIKGFPRFFMKWSQLERYDILEGGEKLPYDLVLAVNDIIEEYEKKNK